MNNSNDIQREQSHILYNQSPVLLFVTILLLALILWGYWMKVDQALLITWAVMVSILTFLRVGLVWRFQVDSEDNPPRYWLNLFTLSCFLSGVLWGVVLLYILQPSLDSDVLVINFILTGMAAGSLVPLSTYLPSYYAFSIPTLLPFSFYLLNQLGTEYLITGSLVVVYLVALMVLSVFVNRNILDTIRLHFENSDLLEDSKVQRKLAEKANRDKSRFLAATSHDLRQPLHALDLYLGALRIQLNEGEHLKLINKISASSNVLSDLLNTLMDISRLDSGGVNINKTYFFLSGLLASISNEFEEQAKEKGIVIESDYNEVVVNTDSVLLGRMLRNLVSNAIKHNENCRLNITTLEQDGYVNITIQDNGQGIVASELDNIFSEFYQLNNPERDRTKGLGLGLAIVKRLSELLAIPIVVESEEGKGSRFTLSLTIAIDKRNIDQPTTVDAVDSMTLAGLFIIVIDDEKTVRDATRMLLRSWGCEVLVVSSQLKLLAAFSQDNYPAPDLVISDYRLRENKSGLDAALAVRDYFNIEIPVLIVTGDSAEKIAAEIAVSNHTLLLKPVGSQTLRNTIERVLKA